MKNIVWALVLLLVILHQDLWYWDDAQLVFGFLPISLLYHALLSVAAGGTWWLATKYAWPDLDGGDASAGSDGCIRHELFPIGHRALDTRIRHAGLRSRLR